MSGSCAKHDAGQNPYFKSPQFGQNIQPVGRIGLIELNGPPDNLNLVSQSRILQSGAPTGGHFRVGPGDHGRDSAGSGRVANAHVAAGDQVRSGINLILSGLDAPDI